MATKNKPKRIGIFSDPHCGSSYGLTPEEYLPGKVHPIREGLLEMWRFFTSELDRVKRERPIDIGVFPGDLIDGHGIKSLGTEELDADEFSQVQQAASIVRLIGAKQNYFVTGTPYHTGAGAEFERFLAREFGGKIERHLSLTVNGVKFDVRHHAGRSSIPYGMVSAAKDAMWAEVIAARKQQKPPDIILRGHTHWYRYMGQDGWLAMHLPCLELPGTKYGSKCSGDYTIGFIVFDVDEEGGYTWQAHLARLQAAEVPEYVA